MPPANEETKPSLPPISKAPARPRPIPKTCISKRRESGVVCCQQQVQQARWTSATTRPQSAKGTARLVRVPYDCKNARKRFTRFPGRIVGCQSRIRHHTPSRDFSPSFPWASRSTSMSSGGIKGGGHGGGGSGPAGQSKKNQVFLRNLPLAMLEPVSWWPWLLWTAVTYVYSAYLRLFELGRVS